MPAVSVIVLVYKVEEYIAKCARSLFGQTLRDVEFVIVDDCSPDRSMEVLTKILDNEFPERREQVRIIRNERNSGQAYSRRRGIDNCTGKYTIHCDSDDWMELNMLERMYQEAEKYEADAVVCGWFRDDRLVESKYTVPGKNLRDYIVGDMVRVGEMQSLWRYMVKRQLYRNDIDLPISDQGEDHAILVQLAYFSKSIYCIKDHLYHWRTNMSSITNNPSPQGVLRRFEGACANTRLVQSFFVGKGEEKNFARQLTALKLYSMFYLRPLLRKGEAIDIWRNEFPEIKGKVLSNKHIKFAHKLEYLVDMYCTPAIIKAVYKWRSHSR